MQDRSTISKSFTSTVMDADVPSGVVTSRSAHEHGCSVLTFSSGGNLATGGHDSSVKVWDLARGSETKSCRLYSAKSISCIAYNAMGNTIACAGNDLQISILRQSGMNLQ
jgi:WD40 repeat protein